MPVIVSDDFHRTKLVSEDEARIIALEKKLEAMLERVIVLESWFKEV